LNFRLSKDNPNPQEMVSFTGLLTQGTGVMTFTWQFGDGSAPAHGQRMSHAYLYGGSYTVQVTATGVACPINRSTTITGTVTVGGAAPLFLPFVASQTASRTGSSPRPVSVPGPVGEVMGQMRGGSLRLIWRAPAGGGPVTGYRIYASRAGGAFRPIGMVSMERTAYLVRGQVCGAAYLIAAVGPGGEGPDSVQSYLAPACEDRGGGQ